jgi:hypothetical protein
VPPMKPKPTTARKTRSSKISMALIPIRGSFPSG